MSLSQPPQDNPGMYVEDRFLHLRAIDVDFARARQDSKLEIKLKDGSGLKYKSAVFKKPEPLHWECDILFKFLTNAIISVQKPNIGHWNKVVSEFQLDFNLSEVEDEQVVERKDDKSGVSMKLLFGKSKIDLDVTRLLADKAVSALATKVSMLDKLDQVLGYLDLVLQLGSGAAQLHPAAQVAIPIVTTVFKKFQEIPACHTELVSIMDDIVSMLPVLKLAHERVKDVEVQTLLRNFLDFVVHLSEELLQYSSLPPSEFVYQNWCRSKKGEVATLKDRLTQMKLSLSLGMNVDIKGAVSEIRLHQLSEADEKILERLKPPENSSYDLSHCCLSGTRASFLQDVEQWALSKDHSEQLYWIYGVAGCGKSSVAASVASALKSQKLLSGSFFCKRDIPERRDAVRLVRALAYFLARASAPFRNVVIRVSKDDPIDLNKTLSIQFKELIADPLAELSQSAHSERVIIVLDALDECDEDESVSLYVFQMVKLVPWLRLIVTSRPLQHIQKGLQQSGNLMKACDLFLVNTDEDILFFTRNRFKSNIGLPTDFSDAQIEALSQRSSGLFIWIATVLKHVSIQPFGKSKVLQRILDSTPTASTSEEKLDGVYLRVLNDSSKGSADRKNAIKLVVGLVFVISRNGPLPAEALLAFLPSDLDVVQQELDALLQDLGSVLTKDPQSEDIRACHPSFLDFIGNQKRSGWFWTEAAKLDTLMAKTCFRIMMARLKFNICELDSSCLPNSDVVDLKQRIARYIPRELQYSCIYWMNHLSGSEARHASEELVQEMLHSLLCETTSLYWLEVLSLMSELKAAVVILQNFPHNYKLSEIDAELRSVTSDLYRFLMAFYEPIATSTPHIYVSALLWTPFETVIAKSHGLKFNSRGCVLKGLNRHWPIHLQTWSLDSRVESVAYSPDGRHIVSGSHDKTVRIWDAQSGTLVGEPLQGHDDVVWSVAYSPDGLHIVSGSEDNTVRIWDVQSGTLVCEPLQGHNDVVWSVAYSSDGRHVVSGSLDFTVRIWDAQSGAPVGEPLQGHRHWVTSVAYSPDGRHIVSGSADNTVRIWDAQSGNLVSESLQGHHGVVRSVAYSPDGRHVVSGSDDCTVRIWDVQSGAAVGEPLQGHSESVMSVGYSSDGRHIVSGSHDYTVRIWDALSGAPAGEPLQGHRNWVTTVAYSSNGRHVVSGSVDCTIRIWDVLSGAFVGEPFQGHSDTVMSVAYSSDGRHVISGSHDKTVRIWDALSGALVGEPLQGHDGLVTSVAYSSDGRHVVSGSDDETVRIWDVQSSVPVGEPFQGHSDAVMSVVYSSDGRHIVSGSADNTVHIWDAQNGTLVCAPLQGHDDVVWSVAYSPDERHIVTGSEDGTIRTWDAQSGAPVGGALQGHHGAVRSVIYSPDGRHVVSGSDDGAVCIWDVQGGTLVGEPLQGHGDVVTSVVYSSDGRHIVSGSHDYTVRIWDALGGIPVGEPLQGHDGLVTSVAYSPDGCHVVSGSTDGTVRIWDAQSRPVVDELYPCQSHWNTYSPDENCFISSPMTVGTPKPTIYHSRRPLSIPNDGWIRTFNGGLLLWAPPDYRRRLCDMSLVCIPSNPLEIDWGRLCHGSNWTAVKVDHEND